MTDLPLASLILAIAAGLLIYAPEGQAMTIAENEELTLELRGLGEAGYILADEQHSRDTGPFVGMARLAVRATYHDLGRIFVQYEASSGQANLLDLLAVLYIQDWLHLRLGYFKTPTSADYNVSSAQRPFPDRALITRLTPRRRTGAELFFTAPLAGATANLYAGAFNPRPLGEAADGAVLLAARGEIEWPFGLGLHLGYSDHFDTIERDTPEAAFFVEHPRLISAAATFQTTRWFAHAESVLALTRPADQVFSGVYAALAYRTGDLQNEVTLEPIVGYDYVLPNEEAGFHRVRAGLNAYLLNYRVVPNVHYEMTIPGEGELAHALLALLRMSF